MLHRTIEQIPRLARWWAEMIPGPEVDPEWTTPNRIVLETPSLFLRDFGGGPPGGGQPLLVVAPEVNGSNLADYGEGQSLVVAAKRAGFGRVCVLHWRQVTQETCDRTVDDSILDVERCIEHLGGCVHLLGICQGGWESAIVASRKPDAVASLTLVGSAIDFRAGDGAITRLVDQVPQPVYESIVAASGGVMRGESLRTGFDGLQWFHRAFVEPLSLWNNLDDEAYMERRRRMQGWYRVRKDLPGPQYLQVVDELFRNNKLMQGTFEVLGEPVDLGRISSPVAMVAGTADHISLPEQVFALEPLVASEQTRRFLVPGGHIGILVGGKAHRDHWPEIFGWLRVADAVA
jgi:poly(3-hydroxybutyrate) depolymerase